ncbi:hypothetical protein MAR_021331, partial [Mya arenaria]
MDLPVSVIIFVLCCVMLIFGQGNGLQFEFQRILEVGGSQTIEKIQVDSSSTDRFQVMCRVNNVEEFFKIISLRLQYTSNGHDYTELARLQNTDAANEDTFQKPVLAYGAGSSWTVEGSFGTNINGRDGTLGVSRPVSSITCSDTVGYRCQLSYLKPGPDYFTDTGIISKELIVQDNGMQIYFQRIVEGVGTQPIDQIQVDSSSPDRFQVMCTVNNVNQLFKIGTLRVQYKASKNAQEFTDLAFLQNVDANNEDTYQKPVLAFGTGSGWTVEGSFDSTNSNGRDSTLGVSRLVSSITCSNAVEYRCYISFTRPAPDYFTDTGIISKELDVQYLNLMLPTTIKSNVYYMIGMGSFPITFVDTIEPFYVGQTVKMECSANIGSYNGTAQIRWLKSNLVSGSPLAPYFSPDTELGDLQSTGNCVYQQTDSVTYNMTAQDAGRIAENRLHFQCYVYIPSLYWETPDDQRGNFKFIVYSRGKTSHDDTNVESSSTGTVIGGVVALAVIVVAVLIISRRYQFPFMQTAVSNTMQTVSNSPSDPKLTVSLHAQ